MENRTLKNQSLKTQYGNEHYDRLVSILFFDIFHRNLRFLSFKRKKKEKEEPCETFI